MNQPLRDPLPVAASAALVDAFRQLPTANISDNLDRQPGAVGLHPFHDGTPMAGTALTVRTRNGDNRAIYEALELVRPGDVLVVDGGGDLTRALIGEIMCAIAQSHGAAGIVIDGAIRDTTALAAGSFPVFARASIHRGPYKNGPGEVNVPISIGGMVVSPGDIVVGDSDGVVAFGADTAGTLLTAVLAQKEKEAEILRMIADGTYVSAQARRS